MATIETQELLKLLEETGRLCFWDLESSGTNGDYNSILVGSVKPYGGKVTTFQVGTPGNDKKLVRDLAEHLEGFSAWCGFYSKGFDIKMLRTRMLVHGLTDIQLRPHLDLYYIMKYATNTSRRSQAHLLELLNTPQKKMTVSANVWAEVSADPRKHMKTLVSRCESDVEGLEALYIKTRHLIKDLKR